VKPSVAATSRTRQAHLLRVLAPVDGARRLQQLLLLAPQVLAQVVLGVEAGEPAVEPRPVTGAVLALLLLLAAPLRLAVHGASRLVRSAVGVGQRLAVFGAVGRKGQVGQIGAPLGEVV